MQLRIKSKNIFIFYLLPQITTLLEGMSGGKPFGVRVAMQLGDLLRYHWLAFLIGIAVLVLLTKIWYSVEKNKQTWDKYKLQIPLYVKFLLLVSTFIG